MKGQEHHRHFTIKYFAQFMTRAQVANAFMEEFQDELPKPPTRWHCRDQVSTSKYYRIN